MTTLQERCEAYVSSRTASYEQRTLRFSAVGFQLAQMGLADGDIIYDLGAGHCDFDYWMRHAGWRGRYVPVDGAIDGTDLNYWRPPAHADFFVLMETLEHLTRPRQLLRRLAPLARKGIVLTTPNPATVDVLGCDPTHVSVITRKMLEDEWYTVQDRSFFGKHMDSLMGWK